MNNIHMSGQLEPLCDKLAEKLKEPTDQVFSKTMIITQGGGMNNYLTTRLTKINGIFAHYEFHNQDGFMGQVYELLQGERLKGNRDTIQFGVYKLLESADFKSQFKDVTDYYEGNPLRRIQLAEKITDLFDQYQLYREEMIKSWENGQTTTETPELEKWQMWLWQQLSVPSKGTIRNDIFKILESGEQQDLLRRTWPEIHLFGISIFTNFHKEFYEQLGKYISVHYYLCLPVKETKFSNSLLESFGTKAKELLMQFAGMEKEFVDFPFAGVDTLLGRLQQSISHNRQLTGTDNNPDKSIQVTSHFTPVREVEALYNYLLDLFEKEWETKSLRPHDVLVIAPDINKYEPFVRAVFRNSPVRLPHRISGAAKNIGDSITASLEVIANLGEDDLTADNVMGLLEQNRIGKAYQIEDTTYIRSVLKKAGIRFGRANHLADDTHFVSWTYGLEKLVLGYAMLTEEAIDVSERLTEEEKETLPGGLTNFPYQDAEASKSHDLLRLKAFVDDLQVLLDAQKVSHTLENWKEFFLEKVMGEMVWSNDFDKKDREERNEIYRALGFIDRLQEDAAAGKVPWEVFVNELKKRLFTESREHELNTGAITFTSAIPARGLPYKVIACIGFDNGVFPRQDHHLGFDLMGGDYRPGDRSKKEADKSLFLDTLMAAREKLYLSYIGQSAKDNTEIPPSIVLDTLMDYLNLELEKHPLHGFSAKYDNKNLFTYLYNSAPYPEVHHTKPTKQETVIGSKEEPSKEPGKETEEIWVNEFVKFFEAPIDWYFNKVLGIKYGENDDTLPDTELFGLDSLQKWGIKNELLKFAGSTEVDLDIFIQKRIKLGMLPLKNLGRATVEELLDEIKPVKERYRELTSGKQDQSVAIDLSVDGVRITGTIDGVFDTEYIHVTTSTSEDLDKYKVRAYINALLLFASGVIKTARLLALKKNKGISLVEEPFPYIDKETARRNLFELSEYLIKGKNKPLVFCFKATKPNKGEQEITVQSVFNGLKAEADGRTYVDPPIPGNKYILTLIDEGYFDNLAERDIEDIKKLASLLNL